MSGLLSLLSPKKHASNQRPTRETYGRGPRHQTQKGKPLGLRRSGSGANNLYGRFTPLTYSSMVTYHEQL